MPDKSPEEWKKANIYHGYLNQLYAGFQYCFTHANAIRQMQGESGPSQELDEIAEKLGRLGKYFKELSFETVVDLQKRDGLLCAIATDLIDLSDELVDSKFQTSEKLDEIYASHRKGNDLNREELCFLAASAVAQSYSREHFIKGLIHYGEVFGQESVSDRWRQHLFSCQREIAHASYFFNYIVDGHPIDDYKFIDKILDWCLLLSGLLRTQVNDIAQVSCERLGTFGFESAGFSSEETDAWEALGCDALAAGDWRAYGFDPLTALEWIKAGAGMGAQAASWERRGFTPEEAVPWLSEGIRPSSAVAYKKQGYKHPKDISKH